ncbi:mediator of RNA polymerase II transcription subunit 26 [Phlebotomus papatasi]|uniref:mediator of RNA polymerase II transcription subunit 26 n=1 Tax=Phlebotomus papatasi TaxID=29031 RepID=UPI0024842312|nr:mediator of RNA polymerase II transcription subunit 26 [Phlebotomus papatasi]
MSQTLSELSRRLENALDKNYNVLDLSAAMEVVEVLESTVVTIEQLESTQLTRSINHMRRRTSNEHLARRMKNLLKKWRQLLPQVPVQLPNGTADKVRRNGAPDPEDDEAIRRRKKRRKQVALDEDTIQAPPQLPPLPESASNSSTDELNFRGRFGPASPVPPPDISSSNSGSAFRDSGSVSPHEMAPQMSAVTVLPAAVPVKRRGRKKGSRGVDASISDAYDTSPYLEFKHKVASGPKKVKTTKELLADLQNRKLNSSATSSPILTVRPPSPTQILHSDGSQSHEPYAEEAPSTEGEPTTEEPEAPSGDSGGGQLDVEEEIRELRRQLLALADDQAIDEEVPESTCSCTFVEIDETEVVGGGGGEPPTWLEVGGGGEIGGAKAAVTTEKEGIDTRRPPPIRSIFDLDETDDHRIEKVPTDAAAAGVVSTNPTFPTFKCIEDPECPANREVGHVTSEDILALHSLPLEHVNGNWSMVGVHHSGDTVVTPPSLQLSNACDSDGGVYERVVPQYNHIVMDRIPKCPPPEGIRWHRKCPKAKNNNPEDSLMVAPQANRVFREWFETVQLPSYNDELLTILPYVVID